MSWKRPTVLVVEDDEEMRNLLFEELWNEGYQLREARDGDEAFMAMLQSMPDLIITDLRMPSGGLEYVSRLRMFAPHCPIIVMSAFADERAKADATRAGATAFVNKPVHLSELKGRVKALLPVKQ
ncbi:response regulator transcription factor [Nitrospira moscoviensis]|uniref:Putative Response regulator, CheY-like n=1 Tax=Nitrospira moscoviensis TaxID=42253 RepID=A0A0K2GHN0_NITMO|nr:response regulator [Nitrospira moscoviensis]ALA60374.1 Putative Response regulator, CheY-like [Nitrospira moscoviensis]